MAHVSFQQEYMQIPVITRTYTTACLFTTLAVQLEIISPFQIYFNPDLIINQWQVWRIFTNFLYFGKLEFNFFFNMLFLYRYCRMLEEGSFRGRTADFVFMFMLGGTAMCCIGLFVSLVFLGHAFTIMLVYIWSQRNPYVRMSFFGILTFRAPYLPWVLIGFSIMLGNPIIVDGIGIAAGHIYYFLEDVFPKQPAGFKIMHTPRFMKYLFDPAPESEDYTTLPEAERPGGFDWGQPEEQRPANEQGDNQSPADAQGDNQSPADAQDDNQRPADAQDDR